MGGRRWLFICCDGWGLGHVARMIGLARNIRQRQPDGEFLFLTDNEASFLIWQEGFASVKLPCFEFFRKEDTRAIEFGINEDVARSVVGPVITAYRPDVVVVDTYPFGYRNEYASLQFFRGRKVLVYAEHRESKRNRLYEIGVRSYNLILLPYVSGEVELLLPRGLRVTWVGPILPRSRADSVPRDVARARLGLPAEGRVCFICFGGGGDPTYTRLVDWVLSVANRFPDWIFAVPIPPLLTGAPPTNLPANAVSFRYFPVSECFSAFDAAISITGNTVFELAHFGVPTVVVPKTTVTDEDHVAKARNIVAGDRGYVVEEYDTDALMAALDALRDDGRRESIAKALTEAYGGIDGAAYAADLLVKWVAQPPAEQAQKTGESRPSS
jgi:predicted glycosyltransferase